MFKKIINKIIMGTKCYKMLQSAFNDKETRIETLTRMLKEVEEFRDKQSEYEAIIITYQNKLKINQRYARQIVRQINKGNLDKAKDICNQIIKGE